MTWSLSLTDGAQLRCKTVITATGQLSEPSIPDLCRLSHFRGKMFHSAGWHHAYPLEGKDVAVIACGASATQFVPVIPSQVKNLTLFQRSPGDLMLQSVKEYSASRKKIFTIIPWLSKVERLRSYLFYQVRALALTRFHRLLVPVVVRQFQEMLLQQVQVPAPRTWFAPKYQVGCKPILLSSDYLATLTCPNVSLEDSAIARVVHDGIKTVDGKHHAVDAIIFGTWLKAPKFLTPIKVINPCGRDLNEFWRGGARAFLGMSIVGMPNFFMLYGPTTNLGHNSIIYMLKAQAAHIMRVLRESRARGTRRIEIRQSVFKTFNAALYRRLENSIWRSWNSFYRDLSGRITKNWPGSSLTYRWQALHARINDYYFTHSVEPTVHHTAQADRQNFRSI